MEKKQIKVGDFEYDFSYDKSLNMWRVIESSDVIEGHSIDIEIDLGNFTTPMDWTKVEKFIELVRNNNKLYIERISDAKQVLKTLFQSINKNYSQEFIEQIEFILSGIDFKGNCKIVNLEDRFIYDYFFFPVYTKEPYRDIGSFVWRANFRDSLLLGVYCNRL